MYCKKINNIKETKIPKTRCKEVKGKKELTRDLYEGKCRKIKKAIKVKKKA